MNWTFLFFSLKGRINRLDWWIGRLTVLALTYGLSMGLLQLLGGDPAFYWDDHPPTPRTALVDALIFVILLRFSLAVDIKRIHDRGRSAYLLVPLYLAELAIILLGGTSNRSLLIDLETPDLTEASSFEPLLVFGLMVGFLFYVLWLIAELGFRKGINGPSKYGPDPILREPTDPASINPKQG